MKSRIFLFALLCGLLLPGVVTTNAQETEGQRWTPPVLLGDGWWQSVTTDVEGGFHVAWYGNVDTPDNIPHDVMDYAVRSLDGTWSHAKDVIYTTDGGYTVRNAIATTSDGMLHAIFRTKVNHQFSSAPISGALDAANWSAPVEISANGYYVDMTSDRHNYLHVAFSGNVEGRPETGAGRPEASACPYCQDLFYRRSIDGGKSWEDPYPVSILENTGSDRMDIFEAASGRLFIIWDEGYDWNVGKGQAQDIRIVYSDDSGVTWTDPIILDGGNFADRRPIQISLTEMRDGSWMVIWRYSNDIDRNIYYQITSDSGVTWTTPQPIPGIVARETNDTPLDDYDMLTDRLGTVHAFVVAQPNQLSTANPGLYHLTYSQGVWGAPQRVFYSPDMRPEWPKAEPGLSNDIHLAWFIRGIRENVPGPQSSTDILKVYYSYLNGSLQPEATVAFLPTQTPQPTPTLFLNMDATSTPAPTLSGLEPGQVTFTRDTYGANVVLGGILASGLFCAVIVLVARFWRRL